MPEHHPRQRRPQSNHRAAPAPGGRPHSVPSKYGTNHANGFHPANSRSEPTPRVQPTHYSQIDDPPMNRCPACRSKVPAGGLELHRRECHRKA